MIRIRVLLLCCMQPLHSSLPHRPEVDAGLSGRHMRLILGWRACMPQDEDPREFVASSFEKGRGSSGYFDSCSRVLTPTHVVLYSPLGSVSILGWNGLPARLFRLPAGIPSVGRRNHWQSLTESGRLPDSTVW